MDASTDNDQRIAYHPRVEDDVLVRGHGRYVADAPQPNQAYAHFVRSPHAFARIVSIDVGGAANAPGVIGVLTGKDMEGVGNLGRHPPVPGRGGKGLVLPHRPALAVERVVHIGEPVAMVVAETAAAAQDAAEFVSVEYDELPPVIDARAALAEGEQTAEAAIRLAIGWIHKKRGATLEIKTAAHNETNARHFGGFMCSHDAGERIKVDDAKRLDAENGSG